MPNGAHIGSALAGGTRMEIRPEGVICSVTPTQLYDRLLKPANVPANVAIE